MLYYWVLCGYLVLYFFIKPSYQPLWGELSDGVNLCLGVLFMVFEMLNFKCHCIVAALRKPGTNERGIPSGYGFGVVTVANYMWEGFAWTTFVPLAQTRGAIAFMIFSWTAMYVRGREKH